MALIATVRRIPQLYYGSEIGMSGDKDKEMLTSSRFPRSWLGDENNALRKKPYF
jgi:glycosidase